MGCLYAACFSLYFIFSALMPLLLFFFFLLSSAVSFSTLFLYFFLLFSAVYTLIEGFNRSCTHCAEAEVECLFVYYLFILLFICMQMFYCFISSLWVALPLGRSEGSKGSFAQPKLSIVQVILFNYLINIFTCCMHAPMHACMHAWIAQCSYMHACMHAGTGCAI